MADLLHNAAVQVKRGLHRLNDERALNGFIRKSSVPVPPLSAAQKQAINALYDKYGIRTTTKWHRFYTAINGEFSANYIPNHLFREYIEPFYDNRQIAYAWSDKNLYDRLFPEVEFPITILRNQGGYFFDRDYCQISAEQARDLLTPYAEYVVKPSLDNGGGKNVRLISTAEDKATLFDHYQKDYIIQERLRQSAQFNAFNASSVNVMRLLTFRRRGETRLITTALRIGAEGAFIDNYISRDKKGMIVIGVREDGTLKDFGCYASGQRITALPNGHSFAGCKIASFARARQLVMKMHEQLPHFALVGWDVAENENGEPVIIELNICAQGIVYYQYVNGPIFGDLTEEVYSDVFRPGRG